MKRIFIWASPRNMSTAFMYSFAQRNDTCVIDEPHYGHYLKVNNPNHPGKEEILKSVETNGQTINQEILAYTSNKKIIFIKNMAHHVSDLDMGFLSNFYNIFLTRDPKLMIASYIKKAPHVSLKDTGYKDQYELLKMLIDKSSNPIVIDSNRLLKNPENILKKLCAHCEIPFSKRMLYWNKGPIKEDGMWAKYWYKNVHNSTGFIPYQKKEVTTNSKYIPLVKECNYYYKSMLEHSL